MFIEIEKKSSLTGEFPLSFEKQIQFQTKEKFC